MMLRRGRGIASVAWLVVAILGPTTSRPSLAEDLVPAVLERRPVVHELLAEGHEDHILLSDLRVDLGERVRAAAGRLELQPEGGEARLTHALLALRAVHPVEQQLRRSRARRSP